MSSYSLNWNIGPEHIGIITPEELRYALTLQIERRLIELCKAQTGAVRFMLESGFPPHSFQNDARQLVASADARIAFECKTDSTGGCYPAATGGGMEKHDDRPCQAFERWFGQEEGAAASRINEVDPRVLQSQSNVAALRESILELMAERIIDVITGWNWAHRIPQPHDPEDRSNLRASLGTRTLETLPSTLLDKFFPERGSGDVKSDPNS